MLKKQTVWLLTMLSLMIVLSVYYIMSDTDELAYINTDTDNEVGQFTDEKGEQTDGDDAADVEVENISELGMSELFATIRMEMEDERSLQKERLKEIIASSDATTMEINEAMNTINEIDKIAAKERVLQEMILTTFDHYEDVLVRSEDDKVHVHVITEQMPRSEAVQIMQMVRDELGEKTVDVHFQQK
ncbi:MAG: SpoIIIAH-like family protein [Bacilli bacterium]|nr:SpoIIIAH-like family protein [Bacilli bacterium]